MWQSCSVPAGERVAKSSYSRHGSKLAQAPSLIVVAQPVEAMRGARCESESEGEGEGEGDGDDLADGQRNYRWKLYVGSCTKLSPADLFRVGHLNGPNMYFCVKAPRIEIHGAGGRTTVAKRKRNEKLSVGLSLAGASESIVSKASELCREHRHGHGQRSLNCK